MQPPTLKSLLLAAETFTISNSSYQKSYQEFLKYFQSIDIITEHHLIISSHFVYGWMPTILHIDTGNIHRILTSLNNAKSGRLLTADDLEIIKKFMNNSMVGTSKLLHFIHPNIYAIWDSRVFRYMTGKKSSYSINKPGVYLDYLWALQEITQHEDYWALHKIIERKLDYKVSPLRAIEVLMFETDKQRYSRISTTKSHQIDEVQAAVTDANNGDFASEGKVNAVFAKYWA